MRFHAAIAMLAVAAASAAADLTTIARSYMGPVTIASDLQSF